MRKHFRARIISFMGACVVTFLRGMELYSLRGHVEFIDLDWSRSFAVFHVYKICKKWTKFSYACFQLHTESLLYQAPGEDRKLLEWSFLDAGFRCRSESLSISFLGSSHSLHVPAHGCHNADDVTSRGTSSSPAEKLKQALSTSGSETASSRAYNIYMAVVVST